MKKRTVKKPARKQEVGSLGDEILKICSNVVLIPVEEICPDPDQPRKFFDEAALGTLSNSMYTHGQLTPIWVRKLTKPIGIAKFAIIEGERRWRAAPPAKIKELRCLIFDVTEKDKDRITELQIIANSNREPLTVLENCAAIKALHEKGARPVDLMKIFGKSLPWVYQHINLSALHPDALQFLGPPTPEENRISFCTALLLLEVDSRLQTELACEISSKKMTMVEAKAFIRKAVVNKTGKSGISRPKREFEILFGHARRFEKWLEITNNTDPIQLNHIFGSILPESKKAFLDKLTDLRLKCQVLWNTINDLRIKSRPSGEKKDGGTSGKGKK